MTEGSRSTSSSRKEGRRPEPSPSELVDRSKSVRFEFNGRRVTACEGDTVASALYASGVRIFSRSFKYHRPRGLLCVSGRCPNCLMSVDGVPNVKACTEKVREGMRVKSQNCWPSPEHDIFSLIDKIGRFLPVGFYYKTFINSPIEWSRVEGIIRRLTGLGSIEEELALTTNSGSKGEENPSDHFEHLHLQADVAVIGGGPSGTFAALEASNAGAKVVLVDDQPVLGGHLRYGGETLTIDVATGEGGYSGLKSSDLASILEKAVRDRPNVMVLNNATAFGIYESNLVGVVQGKRVVRLRTDQLVLATGAHEFPSVFQNNDLPGVFLGMGLQRLVNLYGVIPGKRAVVVSNNDSGLGVACTLMDAGVKIEAYVDVRKALDESHELTRLKGAKVQIVLGFAVKEARGTKRVNCVVIGEIDGSGKLVPETERVLSCDVVSLSSGVETEAWLLTQTGSRTVYDEVLERFVPGELRPSVHACGDLTGVHDIDVAIIQGKVAGLSAALSLPSRDRTTSEIKVEHQRKSLDTYSRLVSQYENRYRERMVRIKGPPILAVEYPGSEKMQKRFVCVCEDVVAKDISLAAFEGFDDIETLKRYSTVTMGPCQGKMCSMSSLYLCGRATGRSIAQTGRTVSRPPYVPVSMGALSGAELHPVKLTAMHYKHLELGARIMDMGEWKRPHVYTSVEDEYKAVREGVGIIDVSTLGRLDVKGRDAGKLLDFIYTHIFSTLKVGKSRYGVICDDAGIILDDGTVTRLSEGHYFITTTTGNVDFVEQWLGWWATALGLDAHVTNVTAGLAAVNVAGPKARDLLRKLTTIDLSAEAFPYMNSAEGNVAGVPCILLRIGFVGETGWEIHFPAELGEYFWDALLEAGKEFGVKPFGVETQRVLRLEKKHVIVGQDTDALSNPFEADMAWTVKFEKDDFIGKPALRAAEKKESERRLVGFVMKNSAVAHDGDQVFSSDGNRHIGFVTSSRFSPPLGKCVGMALLTPEYHKEASLVKVKSDDALNDAEVALAPFYDPEGKRLRS